MQYQSYDCEQLAAEIGRVQVRANQLGGRLDEAAFNDKALTAGALVFWPALFALGGTKQQEAEYARLRGEHDALLQSAVLKKCSGSVTDPQAGASSAVSPATQHVVTSTSDHD